jgi:predicted RNA-binding protein YlxR (DUF448 family)
MKMAAKKKAAKKALRVLRRATSRGAYLHTRLNFFLHAVVRRALGDHLRHDRKQRQVAAA